MVVVGSGTTVYAATTFFGEDCSPYDPERIVGKTCNDLNNLNDRVIALELIHNSPLPIELTLELDPESITEGEDFTVFGEVPYVEGLTLTLLVFEPGRSTIVHIASVVPNQDGSYFEVINTGGPTWTVSGDYPVQVAYNGESIEELLEYTIPIELTLELNPSSVMAGENFTASGVVPYVEGLDVVFLEILHPDSLILLYDSTPSVEQDGSYSDLIFTGDEYWTVSDDYTVEVIYNGESVQALLNYTIP